MDMETQELLRRTLALTEENNKILRSMQRQARLARGYYILKWIIILAVLCAGFYYAQPYIEDVVRLYNGLNDGVNIMFRNSMLLK